MNRLSAHVVLRKAEYWTRSIAQHDAAHIVTRRSQGGIPRYFLACGNSVTGGRIATWQRINDLHAHVCVGCVKAVTS